VEIRLLGMDRKESLQEGIPMGLFDRLLLASWVYSYAALLVIFGILKRFEAGRRSS
jgi:hypothetical protein